MQELLVQVIGKLEHPVKLSPPFGLVIVTGGTTVNVVAETSDNVKSPEL